jgi:hypothetical protein
VLLFFGIGKSIAIPICPAIGGVKWVASVTANDARRHSEHKGGQYSKYSFFESVFVFHFSSQVGLLRNPLFLLYV